MAEETKACNLTQDEIKQLIIWNSYSLKEGNLSDCMERMNYFHKRLKAFGEYEAPPPQPTNAAASAWPTNG